MLMSPAKFCSDRRTQKRYQLAKNEIIDFSVRFYNRKDNGAINFLFDDVDH